MSEYLQKVIFLSQNDYDALASGETVSHGDITLTGLNSSYLYLTNNVNNEGAGGQTYSSETASNGGTTLSLVTTGEKYIWNNKSNLALGITSSDAATGNHTHGNIENNGTIGSSNNLVITSSGTIEAGVAISSTISSQSQNTQFLREDGVWAIPSYTSYSNETGSSSGTTLSLVTTGEKYIWNQKQDQIVILSYGNSTWDDFIDAYNKNAVVYCRASSNANPSSGSQNRLAFMAYINGTQEVEFQYYRSISSHSSSQMDDQVFVYKLHKTNGWSVTTREASLKQLSGSAGIDISYNSSKNTATVKTALVSETKLNSASSAATEVAGRVYPIAMDTNGKLAVNVPWEAVPIASDATPQALNSTAAAGTSGDYSRADHVHPAPTIDATPTASSTNAVQSGGVKSAVDQINANIAIVENGDTATQTINAGQYVVWQGVLYTADAAIPADTAFATSGGNKNLTAVPNGGLNVLNRPNPVLYYHFDNGGGSHTFTIASGSRLLLTSTDSSVNSLGMWFISTTGAGAVVKKDVIAASDITLNTATANKLKVTVAGGTWLKFENLTGNNATERVSV